MQQGREIQSTLVTQDKCRDMLMPGIKKWPVYMTQICLFVTVNRDSSYSIVLTDNLRLEQIIGAMTFLQIAMNKSCIVCWVHKAENTSFLNAWNWILLPALLVSDGFFSVLASVPYWICYWFIWLLLAAFHLPVCVSLGQIGIRQAQSESTGRHQSLTWHNMQPW